MPSESRKTGDVAEDVVVKYAKDQNWKILARNFQKPWGEIDIVARDKKTILFIEVKSTSKKSQNFNPENNFDYRKKQKVTRACRSYLSEYNYPESTDWRMDLATVELDMENRNARVTYYKNVAV